MFNRRSAILIALLSIAAPAQDQRTSHWVEDLHHLSATLSAKGSAVDFKRGISTRGQKDFEKLYPSFHADMQALESDIPKLSDGEIVLRLMKIIASANVAHNVVQTPIGLGFFSRLPLGVVWYSDGLAIMQASAEYEAALGTRVLRIGDKTPEQVLHELTPYIAHENDVWLRETSAGLLRSRAVLERAGVIDSNGAVTLTLERPGSAPFSLTVKPGDSRIKLTSAFDALHIPTPLARSRLRENYWYQYLEANKALFIQYNSCVDDPKAPFSKFAAAAMAEADAHRVTRVIIDMRWNGGGDSRVIHPLRSGLEARLNKLESVYVLIGPRTFSSGLDNAIDLRTHLHATVLGEPSGGEASSYGEVKYVTLPNSKLVVQYTTKWFGTPKGAESGALRPDVVTPSNLADVLAGRDPAMDAALGSR
jgi:hypothetical protein